METEATCIMITGAMRTTPIKVMEMFLDLPTLSIVLETTDLMAAYSPPRPNQKALETDMTIWKKAEKVDNKFVMIKDHTTP